MSWWGVVLRVVICFIASILLLAALFKVTKNLD